MYGFDILIDEDMKPWLLEVNLSPSLGCDAPLDLRVKSSMMADLLTLVGLPAVDPTSSCPPIQRHGRARTAPTERNQYRRAQSADTGPGIRSTVGNSRLLQQSSVRSTGRDNGSGRLTGSASTLTAEESRLLTQLRDDHERRGDFHRIFPTEDSGALYGDLLDTLSSSPALAVPVGCLNMNRIIHERLFPRVNLLQNGVVSNQRANSNNNNSSSSSSSVASSNTTGSSGSRLPPRAPYISRRSGRVITMSNGRNTQSATAPIRIQTIHWAHPNWRSLSEESDGSDPSGSVYEDAVLQPLNIDNHRSG